MRPVSPVIPTADLNEIVVAENQPEYQNPPAVHVGDGVLPTRWKADEAERKRISETGDVYVSMMTFGNPVMPLLLQAEPPAVPVEDETRKCGICPVCFEERELSAIFKPSPNEQDVKVCSVDCAIHLDVKQSELKEKSAVSVQTGKQKYRIRCSFDAAPFAWGMEDGVTNQNWIIPRNAEQSAPELRSETYPGYLKDDERLFEGKGIKHTGFEQYVETHKGKIIVSEDTWIVTNPNGEKEVYLSENFHQIYSAETD